MDILNVLLLFIFCLWPFSVLAAWQAYDDAGQHIILFQPARRIITLAPNLCEIVFAAGAGAYLVGVSDYSDYPAAAKKIPRISSYSGIDLEKILALHPALIIVWQGGNSPAALQQLQHFTTPVYYSNPRHITDIAQTMVNIGRLAGTEKIAEMQAHRFLQRYQQLQQTYADKNSLRVFYPIWQQPLLTIGGNSLINEVIQLCGGNNIFASTKAVTLAVDLESVIASDPQVIIGDQNIARWQDLWRAWPQLTAVKQQHLLSIPAADLQRYSPRLLDGAAKLCQQMAKLTD